MSDKKFAIKEIISINGQQYKGSINISDTISSIDMLDVKGALGNDCFLIKQQTASELRMKRILHNDLIDELFNKVLTDRYLEIDDTFTFRVIAKMLEGLDIQHDTSYIWKTWALNNTYVIKLK